MSRQRPLIVIADDDAAITQMLHALLSEEGYDTISCFSGEMAYKAITEEQPDLAILDLQMEQRDTGMVVLQQLRLKPQTVDIPVMLCSADARFLHEQSQRVQLHRCVVVEKPFNIFDLLFKISTLLHSP
jgi:CheY-like chemotaxis protein